VENFFIILQDIFTSDDVENYFLNTTNATKSFSKADLENFLNTTVEDVFLNTTMSFKALGAVVFDEESFDAAGNVRHDSSVKYKIRLRAEQLDPEEDQQSRLRRADKWLTSHMFPRRQKVGPRGDEYGGHKPG